MKRIFQTGLIGGCLRLEDCAVVLAEGKCCEITAIALLADDAPAGVVRPP